MRVLVTGAGGFVGRALVRSLVPDHEVVALDRACAGIEGGDIVDGDFADPDTVARAVGDGVDAIVHLATLPGGASDADPALGWKVNVDGSALLLEAAERLGICPRVVFASSIAALGDPFPSRVDDATPLRPRMRYGAHKAMIEQWIAALTRRGAIAGLSVRLSGIVARPPGPSGMKSAFLSDVFHAALAGERFVAPVSPDASTWLMSLPRIVANLRHALDAAPRAGEPHAVTLPAVRVTMGALASEIARQAGSDPALVGYAPDPALEAGFGRFPPLATPAAEALGFRADESLEALVAAALDQIRLGA